MYEVLKNVILSKNFELEDIYKKIDTLWVQRDLTDEQKQELYDLATQHATVVVPETLKLIEQLQKELKVLEARLTKLENGGVTPQPPATITIPTWKPWDGLSKDYVQGAVVSHNKKYFVSIHAGQNVWEPSGSMIGRMWKEITKEQAEAVLSGKLNPQDIM